MDDFEDALRKSNAWVEQLKEFNHKEVVVVVVLCVIVPLYSQYDETAICSKVCENNGLDFNLVDEHNSSKMIGDECLCQSFHNGTLTDIWVDR